MATLFGIPDRTNSPVEQLFSQAAAYDDPKNPQFNRNTARSLYEQAASRGWAAAAHVLGQHWAKGTYGSIDREKALSYLEEASKRKYASAAAEIAELLQQDPENYYNMPVYLKVLELLADAAKERDHGAYFKIASDRAYSPDFSFGRELYEAAAAGKSDGRLASEWAVKAALALGLRHMLGVRVEEDWGKARSYLQRAIADGQAMGALSEKIHMAKAALRTMEELGKPTPEAGAKIREVHGVDPVKGGQWMKSLREGGGGHISEEVAERAAAASLLHQLEIPHLPFPWIHIARALDCQLLCAKWEVCERSAHDFGPMYNEMFHLLPKLGNVRPALTEGMGAFLGLETTSAGDIKFAFDTPRDPVGPLLTQQDVSVALALVFGGSKPVMPYISIESIKSSVSGRDRTVQEKVWEPPWTGRTLLGKTLFATDYWAGWLLGGASTNLEWSKVKGGEMSAQGIQFLEQLSNAGGNFTGKASRVMVHPGTFYRTWATLKDGRVRCEVHKLAMRFLGANVVVRNDGTEDRGANENDDRFYAGRVANLVTREYDTLAKLMPVFERTRQLMSLLTALKELREQGFQPSSDIREGVRQTLRQFNSQSAIPQAERLAL